MATPWPEFAARVLALYQPPLRSPATSSKMRAILQKLSEHVQSPSDLSPTNVAHYVRTRATVVKTNTIIGELGYVRAVCSIAVEEGELARSPFDSGRLTIRAEPPARKSWHTREDVARALAYLGRLAGESWAGHRLFALASTVAYTGMRRNEALYLRLEDLDLAERVILIEARAGSRLKTLASAAPVPVPPPLVEVLAGWAPCCGSEWLFPGARRLGPWTGGMPGSKPLDRLKQAGEAVGVHGLTWQSLRHSWATHAEAWGLGEALIQRVLRHTRPLTSRRYRHADVANLTAAVRGVSYAASSSTSPSSVPTAS